MSKVALVLLAAGGSSRMGKPKQLLAYKGQSLLRRAAEVAVNSGCQPIVVVTGASSDLVAGELDGLPIVIETNPDWERGMGTSIRAGLNRVSREEPALAAVVILLCDQPYVEATHVRKLCESFRDTAKGTIASTYAGTVGPPCLFAAKRFDVLRHIGDAEGAKRLIMAAGEDCVMIPLPAAEVDVDTPADYEELSSRPV